MDADFLERILLVPEAMKMTGLSRSTMWRLYSKGDFPKPRIISENKIGFLYSELLAWIQGLPVVSVKDGVE